MATVTVKCSGCGGTEIYKNGKSKNATQRYICHASECVTQTFRLEYRYEGAKHGIEQKIIDMAANASGIRDTARVLGISTDKVMDTLKKRKTKISPINLSYINEHPNIERLRYEVVPYYEAFEAELDEMWSYVFSKENPRWLWLAIDHQNGQILAYTFGKRKDEVFRSFHMLLAPFQISIEYGGSNLTVGVKSRRRIQASFTQMIGAATKEIFLFPPM